MSWEVIAAGLVCLVCIELLRRMAPAIGLVDHPGAHRNHANPTPLVGGLGIGVAILVVLLLAGSYTGLWLGALLLLVVGAVDDRSEISHFWRFAAQIAAALAIVLLDGVALTNLGELLPGQAVFLKDWSVPLTIFAIVGVINALNMSDGMDGLLASFSLLVIIFLAAVGGSDEVLLFSLGASLFVFLGYNLRVGRHTARVYLGDAGSTVLGLIIAWFLIHYTQTQPPLLSPVAALWVIALPLVDAVTVLLVRPMSGSSPFAADRKHYHHYLLALAGSVHWTLVCIVLLTVIGFGLASLTTKGVITEPASFAIFMVLFLGWFTTSLVQARRARG